MPTLIRERLFIGDIAAAAEVLTASGGGGVTHVLSLLNSASISFFSEWKDGLFIPAEEMRRVYAGGGVEVEGGSGKLMCVVERAGAELGLVRMAVPLRDMETENLLDYLEVCLDFIDEGRKDGGAVLVHCFAGVSRSAAVITAYLMRAEELSQEDALKSLRECLDYLCPNDGFLDQLKMFEEMGFKVDTRSPTYKRFHLKQIDGLNGNNCNYNREKVIRKQICDQGGLADVEINCHVPLWHGNYGETFYKLGEKIDPSMFGVDPGAVSSQLISDPSKPTIAYRCKKCRRILALQENIVDHIPGEGETCFEWQKRSINSFKQSDEQECTSIFVEPLKWMTAVEEGALEGKLSCAHCEARLGYFNWSGIQCSCGSWITPAFQLQKGRIDLSTL